MATFAVTLDNGSVITFEGNLTGDVPLPDPITSPVTIEPANAADQPLQLTSRAAVADYQTVLGIRVDADGSPVDTLFADTSGTFQVYLRADDAPEFTVNAVGRAFAIARDGVTKMGFFQASDSPIAQPVVPLTTPSVQNVIDALVALGLVAQND